MKIEIRNAAFHGDQSVLPAAAAECAAASNKFWPYHELLIATIMSGQVQQLDKNVLKQIGDYLKLGTEFGQCVDSGKNETKVKDETTQASDKDGVSVTPYFLVNGKVFKGAEPYSTFKTAIDEALAGNK